MKIGLEKRRTVGHGPRHAIPEIPKPEAPSDLWQELDKLNADIVKPVRPPDSFTRPEFANRYGIAVSTARRRIAALLAAGKIKRIGEAASKFQYYVVVKDT